MKKQRADILLFEKNYCESREKSRTLILAGKVRTGPDQLVFKPSEKYPEDTEFIVAQDKQYVSRGAMKLKSVLEKYLSDLTGMIALDIGASTGGFTDLMLQKGAGKVIAVDSGRGQLHGKLRDDPRVVCHEQTNARYIDESIVPEKVDHTDHGCFIYFGKKTAETYFSLSEIRRVSLYTCQAAVRG